VSAVASRPSSGGSPPYSASCSRSARAADQQRQQQRGREHEHRCVERDPRRDPHDAPARQRPGLERGRRARVRAHAERERALERVAVLGGDGVPVDPVGARVQLARGRDHEPLAVAVHAHGRRHRRAAAGRADRGLGQAPVQRLGEHEHDPRRRRLQPLPGRGLGADVRRVSVRARRAQERGEHGGWEREQAHPAESKTGSGLAQWDRIVSRVVSGAVSGAVSGVRSCNPASRDVGV
jgi:hypothetical protein